MKQELALPLKRRTGRKSTWLKLSRKNRDA